ncbi:MAG: Bifunctional homocysteine S-methyltransferase/5,10-methylenetetrahydrofolate reductase [Chloroflexi bacterium ADurb.Bin325]|nr:MAG: Bifunctional homocysteine S-methyltransferase/5,10-methylenetetrahydrofolate reductase [Chloroflexi bacterium ADurb.Bin325]
MNAPTPPVPAPAAPIETGLTGASSNLARVLAAGHFAVCVEIAPPVGPNVEAIQREIRTLRGHGDAYNVTDNQSAMVHVSSLPVSIMLKQAGMEPIVQFTCRDRNRLGLQGDILGASVFGINTMLFLSGDHPIWGDHPQCKAVYDIDSINLIRIARMMRNNRVFENNKQIPKLAPDIFIGAVENPFAPPYDYRPMRLAKKVVAGAQFIQTQLIYNVERFREFMRRVVDLGLHEKVAILAGVGPMKSLRVAEYMKTEVAGMDVPDAVIERMTGLSKEDQQKAGMDICLEVAEQVRNIEGVAGLHIMAVNWSAAVPDIVKQLGLYPRPVIEPAAAEPAGAGPAPA